MVLAYALHVCKHFFFIGGYIENWIVIIDLAKRGYTEVPVGVFQQSGQCTERVGYYRCDFDGECAIPLHDGQMLCIKWANWNRHILELDHQT